jgi:hypothetical protein
MKKLFICIFLIAFMSSLVAFARIDEKSILGIWMMDEGNGVVVKDSSGKGNDGEIFGKVNWVNGKNGKAIEFAGGNVSVPHKEELNLQTFSMTCWLNVPQVVNPYQMVMGKEAWPNRNYSMWLLPDKANVGITSPADQQIQSQAVVVDGKWHHVAATYDMKNLRLFVDGNPSGQSAITSKPLTCEAPFMIGGQPPAGGGGVKGVIDEVCLFNVGLTEDDIKGIFNDGIKQYILAIDIKEKLATTWGALRK